MFLFKRRRPGRKADRNVGDRELFEEQPQNVSDVLGVKLHAIDESNRDLIGRFQFIGQRTRFFTLGMRRIENERKERPDVVIGPFELLRKEVEDLFVVVR